MSEQLDLYIDIEDKETNESSENSERDKYIDENFEKYMQHKTVDANEQDRYEAISFVFFITLCLVFIFFLFVLTKLSIKGLRMRKFYKQMGYVI